MTERIRIGILGAAKIAPSAVVIPARTLHNIEVTAIGARSADAARAFAEAHNIPRFFEGYEPVITSPDVDLVYVALPITHHAQWTIAAAQAGKHVLVEKSFAMSEAEAMAMIVAGGEGGVRIVEALHHSYHPAFARFRNFADSGLLGEIKEVEAEFSLELPLDQGLIQRDPELGGGAMRDLGCYPLHWLQSVDESSIAQIEVQVERDSSGIDEKVSARLQFSSGVIGRLRTSIAQGQPLVRSLRVVGAQGILEFENPLSPHDGSRILLNGEQLAAFDEGSGTTYAHQLDAVCKALLDGTPLPTEGDAILRQQRAMDLVCSHLS